MFISELSTFLTSAFNGIGADLGSKIQFKFDAETGKNDNAKILQGIIKTESTNQLPVKGVKSVKYKFKVELPIPSSLSNKNVILVNSIVEQFSTQYNGTTLDLTDGKGVITMTMPSTGSFKTEFGQGNIVPLGFTIDLLFTQGAITSGDKVWLLDDYVIPYTYEGLVVEKAGKTSLINDRKYAQTLSTSQTKYYHFKFAYDSNNELCVQLQKDLLEGDANKVYELKYYDGKSYTSNAPYQTKVVINRNGDTSSAVPDTAFFDLWFTDADDGNNETKYYLALIDDPFDGTTENERYFNTEAEQQLWYANLVSNGANYCEIKAPNLNSLYLTDQIYTNTAVSGGYDVFDLVNKNFAVIKAVRPATANYLIEIRKPSYDDACDMGNVYWRGTIDGQTVYRKVATPSSQGGGISREAYNQTISQVWTNERFFYYRVTDAQIGLNKQMSYNLRLNSFQTYYFQENPDATKKLSITGSFIEKAHLDRWKYEYVIKNYNTPKPSLSECLTNGYYVKTPDDLLVNLNTDTFTLVTADNYDAATYIYGLKVSFDGDNTSKLFEREDLKGVAKRLVSRSKLKYTTNKSGNTALVNWINENVLYWVYITLSTGDYTIKKFSSNDNSTYSFVSAINDSGTGNGGYYGYSLLCFPVYKTPQSGLVKELFLVNNLTTPTISLGIDANSLKLFQNLNSDAAASFYSMKASVKPPFDLNTDYSGQFAVDSSGNLLILKNGAGEDSQLGDSNIIKVGATYSIFYKQFDPPTPTTFESDITLPTLSYYSGQIIGKDRDKKWNPKLNSIDYKSLTLTMSGNEFEYDLQKVNRTGNLKFDYYEMLTSDTTKGLLKLSSSMLNSNYIFNSAYGKSFNGFSYTNDFSLPYSVDQYSNYIANNKNAYLSFETQQKQSRLNSQISAVSSVPGIVSSFMTGDIAGGIMGIGGNAINYIKAESDRAFERQQFDMSIDNMKNAPNQLANANGNAIFASAVAEFGIYIELYEAIDNELEMANDNMFRNGYTFNRFGQIRDYDHIRKNFNYLKAITGVMNGIPMSDNVRADLANRFAQGIRMWTSDNIEYTKENYEIKLQLELLNR